MDVVYVLGSGSLCNDDEIRYSIRALESTMLDLKDIYIVGRLPDFLYNIKYVPADDSSEKGYLNVYNKIILACNIKELTDEFLLMNDDFFMLKEFKGADFPFYALANSNGGSCGQHSFHIHCPIRLKKDWFLKMPIDKTLVSCHSPRTFYSNFYKAPPKFCDDFILIANLDRADFDFQVKNKPCFSISDSAMLNLVFVNWLKNKYLVPSRFEKLLK